MLSLSKTSASSRCLASRQGRAARPAVSGASLLQGRSRRLRPLSAIPGEPDKDFGLAPESGTGGSNMGRSQGTARPLSGADNAALGSAPESGTRADEGTTGSSSSSSGGRASEGACAAQQAGQGGASPSGGSTSSLTGKAPDGPQDVSAGWGVPSSDTDPSMDPAESKKYTERETQGSNLGPSTGSGSAKPQFRGQQGSEFSEGQGRDESDRQMGGEESGGGSSTRTHPVARTAATAIGSAAGTILGAVGGPVGAAAGAALGGGAARRIADALAGDEGQAEVYDQGAEPEQVAEELLAAREAVGERLEGARDAAGDLADDIRGRAKDLKESAQERLDRASERTEGAARDTKQQMKQQQGSAGREQDDLGGIGTRVQFASDERGRGDTGGSSSSSGSHEHGKSLGGKIAEAAKTAADKMGAAADAVTGHAQFPEYPPAEGKASNYDNIGSAASSSKGEQARSDSSTAPASTASSAGGYSDDKSVGDWVQQGAEKLKDSIADTAGAAADRVPSAQEAKEGLGDALRSTARTAADYGSPETSERLTEMSSQSESGSGGGSSSDQQQQGQRGQESSIPATATASASTAAASDAGWDTADQKWDWGGLPDAEAAVKADVGTPSLMQQDGMDLAGALGTGEGLARRDSERVGALDAAAAGGEERTADSGAPSLGRQDGMGMAGAVGGAGGYGGGASEFGEEMDQMRAQGSSGGAKPQVRSAGGSGRVGVQAVDEGLAEGQLAAGGVDAQAAVGVVREESVGAATSDSTAERVAQRFGVGPEASAGVEEAEVYQREAGQEMKGDEGASRAFEGEGAEVEGA